MVSTGVRLTWRDCKDTNYTWYVWLLSLDPSYTVHFSIFTNSSVLQRPDSVPSMSILIKEVKFTVPQNELIILILRHQVTKYTEILKFNHYCI